MNILLRWITNAVFIFIAANILPGVDVSDFVTTLLVALMLAIVNVVVKPLLIVLTLPATILSLGLFLIVINALMILLVDHFVDGFLVTNFWWALVLSVMLSIMNSLWKDMKNSRDIRGG